MNTTPVPASTNTRQPSTLNFWGPFLALLIAMGTWLGKIIVDKRTAAAVAIADAVGSVAQASADESKPLIIERSSYSTEYPIRQYAPSPPTSTSYSTHIQIDNSVTINVTCTHPISDENVEQKPPQSLKSKRWRLKGFWTDPDKE